MKKLISILLACVLLMASVPLAAAESITWLTALSVVVDMPVDGQEVSYDVGIDSKPVRAAQRSHYTSEVENRYDGVQWTDVTLGRRLKPGDVFVAGHEYTVSVEICTYSDQYLFAKDMTAKINGATVSVNGLGSNGVRCSVSYTFAPCQLQPDPIKFVHIYSLDVPIAGRTPDFEVAYDYAAYELVENRTNTVHGVMWYDTETLAYMKEDDEFMEGHNYTVAVALRAKRPYKFATNGNQSAVSATIFENPATVYSTTQNNADIDEYIWVKTTVDCVTEDQIKGGVQAVNVKVDYPVAGNKPNFEPTLNVSTCDLFREQTLLTEFYQGVCWYDQTRKQYIGRNESFVEGREYTFMAILHIDNIMDESQWFACAPSTADTYASILHATVNNRAARVKKYGKSSFAETVRVEIDFPACNDSVRVYEGIEVSDVVTPVIGSVPDKTGTVTFTYDRGGRKDYTDVDVDVRWYDYTNEREMTGTDAFESGGTYAAVVELKADACSDFLIAEEKGYVGTVAWRGSEMVDSVTLDWNKVAVAAMYGAPISTPDPIDKIRVVGVVPPVAGDLPCETAQIAPEESELLSVAYVKWYENGYSMDPSKPFVAGNSYEAVVIVEAEQPYTFEADNAMITVTVNGKKGNASKVDDIGAKARRGALYVFGTLSATAAVTDYVEADDIMRPAPGQTPDFTASIESAYTEFGGVSWYELDENGYRVGRPMKSGDTFKENTNYRVELLVMASAGRTINVDNRTPCLNGELAHCYYGQGSNTLVVYAEYNTANCISELNVGAVQYPIPGKTPDTTVSFDKRGVHTVAYANGSTLDWYYETNPGTSAAGFARLDGKFKTDRRHQAYVTLETEDGYWFATDKDGNLTVDVYFDHERMAFAYATDTYMYDGAIEKLEAARTFELAKNVGGVFVNGLWLHDGTYLSSDQWGVQTEDTVNKDAGYAYYKNGVLTLHDFVVRTQGDYAIIDSYCPLTVRAEQSSVLVGSQHGICAGDTLTLEGDGRVQMQSHGEGIFAMGAVTVNSGEWIIEDDLYDGIWLYDSMTMNGGTLNVYGKSTAIYGDDFPLVKINGGRLVAASDNDCVIGWCNVNVAAGLTVTVSKDITGEGAAPWDGVTDFMDYSYVEIGSSSDDVLLGDVNEDGVVDMRDSFAVYRVASGVAGFTPEETAIADMNDDGVIDMRDAFAVYRIASGA